MEAAERLPVVRQVLSRIDQGGARAARWSVHLKTGALTRGLMHLLVTGLIENSGRWLAAWARKHDVTDHASFLETRGRIESGAISPGPRLTRMFEGLSEFVEHRIYQGAWWKGVSSRARRVLGGLHDALAGDPLLAEDYTLLRFREENGGPFLRDLQREELQREIGARYRGNASYRRLIVDHIAGMTDLFAVSEYERILGPSPGA